MKPHEKESFIKGVLNQLEMTFGLALIEKIFGSLKEPTSNPIDTITPHLEAMTPHQLNTVMSIANGMMASKAAAATASGDPINGPTKPPIPPG